MAIGSSVSLEDRFGYHRATAETAPKHAEVRQLFYDLAKTVSELIPPGRDASLCLTELQSAMHWANSAIAMETPVDTEPAVAS
jgi:hypothetical protein